MIGEVGSMLLGAALVMSGSYAGWYVTQWAKGWLGRRK